MSEILSNEELCEMIRNKVPDVNDHLQQLYFNNIRLIKKTAAKYCDGNNIEDLMQEAFFGIKRAAEKWSPDQASFTTYADYYIKSYVKRYAESDTNIRIPEYKLCADRTIRDGLKTQSLQEVIFEDDGDPITLEEITPDPNNNIEQAIEGMEKTELKSKLWEMVDDLSDNESKIIHYTYQKDMTLKECSKALHISGERCRQIRNKALKTMGDEKHRKELNPYLIDSMQSFAYKYSTFKRFRLTDTSSVEETIIHFYDNEMSRAKDQE